MGFKRPIQWGTSALAAIAVSKQLVRIDLPEPRDVTVYLHGWFSPDGKNGVSGFYSITAGAGGVANIERRITVPVRGCVIHYVTQTLQVDSEPPGFPVTPDLVSKAHAGFGRPSERVINSAITAGAGNFSQPVKLPEWVTESRIVAANGFGATPIPPLPAGALIQVAQANDPTFSSAALETYPLSAILTNGVIPLTPMSGYWRIGAPVAGDVMVHYQHRVLS